MHLIQFRIRSHPFVHDSGWLTVNKGINLLALESGAESRAILEYLSTLSPVDARQLSLLDKGVHLRHKSGAHTRVVVPQKKTAAIGVFSANADLVGAIAPYDDSLYETDRIEVGRRLDKSIWMNFVEIASSARWGDISHLIERVLADLRACAPPDLYTPLYQLTRPLKGSDRIRRGLDEQLLEHLLPLLEFAPEDLVEQCRPVIELIKKYKRFTRAKEIVFHELPRFRNLTLTEAAKVIVHDSSEGSTQDVYLVDATTARNDAIIQCCSDIERISKHQVIVAVSQNEVQELSRTYRLITPPAPTSP